MFGLCGTFTRDLNGDGHITLNEQHVSIKYEFLPGFFADVAYEALREVHHVTLVGPVGNRLVHEALPQTPPELNDFLVTYSSAFPQRLAGNLFGLCGTLKRDHATVADDATGQWLIRDASSIPQRR